MCSSVCNCQSANYSLVSSSICFLLLSDAISILLFFYHIVLWPFSCGKKWVTWRSSWDYKVKFCKVRALQLLAITWVPSICRSFCQWLQWWETTWAPDVWRAPEECASTPCQASWTQEFHIHSWKTHELLHVSVCQVFRMDCCIKVLLGFV